MNFLTRLTYLFHRKTESMYTVLYTCTRGYPCFRTVSADSTADAAARCKEMTHNFLELVEVRPYVGQQ